MIEAAVAVILAQDEVLLIQRAEHPLDPWSGHVALPGGRRDPGDKDRLGTAVRETYEETGLSLKPEWLAGELDEVQPGSRKLPDITIKPYVFRLPERVAGQCSSEVTACLWTPLKELADSAGPALVQAGGRELRVPAFRAHGRVVWGLTHRILSQLPELSAPAARRDSASDSSL